MLHSKVERIGEQGVAVTSRNLDQHEFNIVDNGKSALSIIYQTQQADLSAEGIDSGLGWITNCWFQEIALGTNKRLFE